LLKKLSTYFQIQIKINSTSYICTSCLRNINENKPPLYQVRIKKKLKIIPLIQKLTQLEERLISPHFFFAQIYRLQGMGNIKCMVVLLMSLQMWIKFIISRLPHDGAIIGVVLNDVLNTNHFICQ